MSLQSSYKEIDNVHMTSQREEQLPAVLDTVELLTKPVYDYIVSEEAEPAV